MRARRAMGRRSSGGAVVSLLPTLFLILRRPDGIGQEATLLEQQPLSAKIFDFVCLDAMDHIQTPYPLQ
jgi:hypothetical protein